MVRFWLTIIACEFYIFIVHAALVMENCIHFPQHKIARGYNCCWALKHVLKAHDILHVVHDNHMQYRFDLHETIRVLDLS